MTPSEEDIDRMSMLPDALIHHILSFNDTQDAVRTCVLSKRWINIWKSLPFLNFGIDGYIMGAVKTFRAQSVTMNDFVDRVLSLRDDFCSIQRFKVSWFSHENNGVLVRVNTWIDAAVQHNVQEVTIELTSRYYGFTYEISPKLLNCKSLKKLTLRMYTDEGIYHVSVILPESMSLQQLKYMCLDGFVVPDVDLSKRLYSSCPVLETLNIQDCEIQTDIQKNFTVESLSLKQFAYAYNRGCGIRKPKLIRLSAPNLKIFTWSSFLELDYYLPNCSDHLSDASLKIIYFYQYGDQPPEIKEEYARRMVKLLEAVDKVKRLELSYGFLMVLSSATDLQNCQFPCLCNLQSLKLEVWFTRGCLRTIAYLLTISPNIKTLILNPDGVGFNYFQRWCSSSRSGLVKSYLSDVGDDWEEGFSLPGMLSHLNVVRIENAEGCDAELKILSFLFKNAEGLEEVSLYPCSTADSIPRSRKKYEDKLRELPRASSHIKMRWGGKNSTCLI